MTKFAKPARTFDEQADLMLARGMVGERDVIASHLQYVNYYRLLGYSYPFRLRGAPNDQFAPGTSFDTIWESYIFDQKLRVLFIEAIERIEVATRTRIAYVHAHKFSPDAYATIPASLPNLRAGPPTDGRTHAAFLERIERHLWDARDQPYLAHFRKKYILSQWPPIWLSCEVISFGTLVALYQGCHDRERETIAAAFNVTSGVFQSWLLMLHNVRNICAHHSRLWNRALGKIPQLPKMNTHPDWYRPVSVSSPKIFSALTVCSYLLDTIVAGSSWRTRVMSLLAEHPNVPTSEMGFPVRWRDSPLWAA